MNASASKTPAPELTTAPGTPLIAVAPSAATLPLPATDLAHDRLLRKLVWQSLATLGVMFALALGAGLVLREPLQEMATEVVRSLGPLGVFLGVLVADGFTFPIPPTTYVIIAVASKSPAMPILVAAAAASVLGGSLAYLVGPWLARLPWIGRRLEAFRPRGEELFQRWGVRAVIIAALTPLPYSIICWLAGIYRMPYRPFALATLVRVPRVFLYYALLTLGWSAHGF